MDVFVNVMQSRKAGVIYYETCRTRDVADEQIAVRASRYRTLYRIRVRPKVKS
jgi:hypothetical protein